MKGFRRRTWIFVFVVGLMQAVCLACADVAYAQTEHDLMDRCLAGRKQLATGVFRAAGRDVRSEASGGVIEVAIYCAFDFPNDLFRFDRTGSARAEGLEASLVKFARTPEGEIVGLPDGNRVARYKRGARVPELNTVQPFDIRLVGLMSFNELPRDLRFSDFDTHKFFRFGGKISEEGASISAITSVYQSGQRRRIIHLNEDRGLTLTKLVHEHRGAATDWSETIANELTWEQRSDIWVPKTLQMRSSNHTLNLEFTWESVNEPIDDKVFSIEGFEMPDGFRIVDHEPR